MPSPLRSVGKHGLEVYNVPVETIVVRPGWNHRETLDVEDLERWVFTHGTHALTPLRVCKQEDGKFWLLAGHRRLQAITNLIARGEPIRTVPVQLETEKDEAKLFALSMSENSGRPLQPHEEALCFQKLINYGWDVADIVKEVGKSSSHVYNRLALLDAKPAVEAAMAMKEISATDGIAIVKRSRKTGERQEDVLDRVVSTKLDRRTKTAKEVPIDIQAGRALVPLVEKYGAGRLLRLLEEWPRVLEGDNGE